MGRVLHGSAAPPQALRGAGCESCPALQRWVQVLRCPAAPRAGAAQCRGAVHIPQHQPGAAQPCSAACCSPRAHGSGWQCYAALQCWVRVLHSPAAPLASLARPCSTACRSCTALQHGVQTLHGPVALFARPASCYRTRCEPCVAPQRCLRVPHGPAARGARVARPCSAAPGSCTALQRCPRVVRHRQQALHDPAVPGMSPVCPGSAAHGSLWTPRCVPWHLLTPWHLLWVRSPARHRAQVACSSRPRRSTGAPPPTPGARAWAARAGQRGRGRCRCRRDAGSCRGTTGRRRGCSGLLGAPAPLRRPPGLRGAVGMRGERVQFLTYPTHVFF